VRRAGRDDEPVQREQRGGGRPRELHVAAMSAAVAAAGGEAGREREPGLAAVKVDEGREAAGGLGGGAGAQGVGDDAAAAQALDFVAHFLCGGSTSVAGKAVVDGESRVACCCVCCFRRLYSPVRCYDRAS